MSIQKFLLTTIVSEFINTIHFKMKLAFIHKCFMFVINEYQPIEFLKKNEANVIHLKILYVCHS